MKYFLLMLSVFMVISCNKDDNSDTSGKSKAIPVYNQAYQQNFERDKIEFIIDNAKNGYVLLDPFQDNVSESIAEIKSNNNQVGAYISIGTGEANREDFAAMQPYLVSTPWADWINEYFVNTTTTGILEIMKARIDKIAAWGCDWVEFDNMDWIYDKELRDEYGYEVTEDEGVSYYQELCDYVHSKGMKCMAKNTVKNASDFDGVLYESYSFKKNWWVQSEVQSFLDAGKLVIINHYNETDCGQVYAEYKGIYNDNLSFICEDANLKKYVHFNLP